MKRKSLSERTIFAKHLTSTVSVMLVMLILGIVGAIAAGARGVSDLLKSRTGFTVVMADEATPQEIAAINRALASDKAVRTFSFSSAEENMARWNAEMDEDVMEILGVNPFPADFSVRVNSDWGTPAQLQALTTRYASLTGVSHITLSTNAVATLNNIISKVTIALIAVAAGLLLISFVLINNTVRLTVYSRRFLIHTMKLVGATGSFIRGPFLRSGVMSGLFAGIVAAGLLATLIYFGRSAHPSAAECLPWTAVWWLFPAMILASMAVCCVASVLATNRYLRLDYDDLF